MSDKLEWMNRHLVLLEYPTVKEAVEKEQYPASSDQLELAENFPASEDFITELEKKQEYKDACCFLAYNLHKRAAVWWAYLCVLDLLEELKKNPAKPRDIEDIGKPKPFKLPEWAKKPEIPEYDPEKEVAEFESYFQKATQQCQEQMSKVDSEMKELFETGWAMVQAEVKKVHGRDLMELMHDACVKYVRQGGQDFVLDIENSPITKATNEVKEKIEKSRQETIRTIKASLPKVDIRAKNKAKLDALDNTYKYIVSPDEDNASNCYLTGNKGPDTPEGLLALVAFWSFGDLDPLGKTVVKTPPGLMSNGLNSLLLMLALAPGGERKVEERYEVYYRLGYDVATGKSNWSESVATQKIPHEDLVAEIRRQMFFAKPDNTANAENAFKVPAKTPPKSSVKNNSYKVVNRFTDGPKEK